MERRIKYSGAGLFWAGQAPKGVFSPIFRRRRHRGGGFKRRHLYQSGRGVSFFLTKPRPKRVNGIFSIRLRSWPLYLLATKTSSCNSLSSCTKDIFLPLSSCNSFLQELFAHIFTDTNVRHPALGCRTSVYSSTVCTQVPRAEQAFYAAHTYK